MWLQGRGLNRAKEGMNMSAVKCIDYVNEAISMLIKAYEQAENMTPAVSAIRASIKTLEDLKLGDFRGPEAVE